MQLGKVLMDRRKNILSGGKGALYPENATISGTCEKKICNAAIWQAVRMIRNFLIITGLA